MTDKRTDELIFRVLSGDFAAPDFARLMRWCEKSDDNLKYFLQLKKLWNLSAGARPDTAEVERKLAELKAGAARFARHDARRRKILYGAAAAVIAIIVAVFAMTRQAGIPDIPVVAQQFPSYNAGDGITLTLEDGTILDVESAAADMTGGTDANPLDGVSISAEAVDYSIMAEAPAEVRMNTLTVGRGRKYMATLSDGTRVWLNSGSTLTYPVKFTGRTREVTMTGECYFEVSRDKERPFFVRTDDLTAEVLGTSFNVTAYENEGVCSITLAQGSVRAISGSDRMVMEPGMRVELDAGGTMSASQVAPDDYSGWRNNRYVFRNATFGQILAKLELWYDVRIVNQSGIDGTMLFNGEFDDTDIESAIHSLCLNTSAGYEYDRQSGIFRITNKKP